MILACANFTLALPVQQPYNVPQANSRLSPLPHEPLNSNGAGDATVDIPLGGGGGTKVG
jgi:hypothetical protein